ncbi:interleukin-18-like [Antechinus flavipes]|uniref:interleukin-18-like n=1 Tax=Antechinus flavipes TaxID=38775 RepID=UPI002236182D|nr:interleukin-18-like [Antechinus flavipes]
MDLAEGIKMATAKDCQEVACAPEEDCKLNPNFIDNMEPKFGEEECLLSCEAVIKFSDPGCVNLKNSNGKIAFFKKEEEVVIFEEMTDHEKIENAPWTQFMLQMYCCNGPTSLVAFSVKSENESYILSCKNYQELHFKHGDFPYTIEDKDQDILFWQSKVIGCEKVEFKSFLYPEYYLAWEKIQDKYEILVLKKKLDNVEMSTMFTYERNRNYEN